MTLLTPASLLNTLETLAAAKNDKESSVTLVTAATLIQQSVVGGVAPEVFEEAIDQVPARLKDYLQAVMNRSVDFHAQDDGGSLALWMLPVVVAVENASLSSVIPLETDSLNYLKLSGLLVKQLGLADAANRAQSGKTGMGWNYIIPNLYSLDQITSADLHALVNLPLQARAVVRGDLRQVDFNCGPLEAPRQGECLYFLPVVVKHPAGVPVNMPAPCELVAARLSTWVSSTIRRADHIEAQVRVSTQPHPFSVALDAGERFALDFKLRSMVAKVCSKVSVHSHGMAALVAPYALQGSGGDVVLGITLVSRMTKAVLATLQVPVNGDGMEEAQLAALTLRDVGMASIQLHVEPIGSVVCQHCGEMQYALPTEEIASRGLLDMATHIQ